MYVFAAASLLILILFALLVMRVATVVLTLTGLSRESARFQVRSAVTGVGFTTSETEAVVNHPLRRRVVMLLMLIGSAGVITAVTTLIVSFAGANREGALWRIVLLVGGLAALLALARSAAFDRLLQRLISRTLARYTDLDVRDYAALLRVSGEYTVAELLVEPEDWVADRRLDELDLPDEGLRVLGIVRPDDSYVGAPAGSTVIEPGDTLVLYGRAEDVAELDRRKAGPAGDEEHLRAAAEGIKV
jgi:TrkA family protein